MNTKILKVGDLSIELPIVPLPGTGISIILFDSLGKTQLIQDLAKEATKNFIKPEVIICPEAKAIPLAQEMARLWNIDYFVLRKAKKLYMKEPESIDIRSITTGGVQHLWYDHGTMHRIQGKKVMIFDDVISTGGTLKGILDFAEENKLEISSINTIFLEGESQLMDEIRQKYSSFEYLCHLPIIQNN